MHPVPVPHLKTAHCGTLHHLEKVILNNVSSIESWFRQQWRKTPAPITSSVDLRNAGFKLSPVDTNLFPAGFNNLNPDFFPLCVQAVQSVFEDHLSQCRRIILLPENHTRNQFYVESLSILKDILIKAGFEVRLGSLNPEVNTPIEFTTLSGSKLHVEPLTRQGSELSLPDFKPCLLLLNNDLSTGIPDILQGITQPICPLPQLGWSSRLKSTHFTHFEQVARDFAEVVDIDPWLINPYFKAVEGVDFMDKTGMEELIDAVDTLLKTIQKKYEAYEVKERPYVVVKADNGTYGMAVMMIHDADQLRTLNRKQRTSMSASKGSRRVERVIVQEGVMTFETMQNGSVAEPVVYMIGHFVVGGFYRVHEGRANDENLNAPGMHFEPLAFAEPCNMPNCNKDPVERPNRFYAYGVIARLAALAAAREMDAVRGES